jgi:hypothetical protein
MGYLQQWVSLLEFLLRSFGNTHLNFVTGKLGAIVSSVGFFQMKDIGGKNAQIPTLLGIFAGFMFIGLLFTFLVPETKGKTLEELSNQPQASVSYQNRNKHQNMENLNFDRNETTSF